MKHLDKYSHGWVKLTDFLDNQNKEYALGLYRLLAETIEDQSYALKLEADLLWYFQDPRALDKYEQAAQSYQDDNNLQAALGVYEQLLDLDNSPDYRKKRNELLKLVQESANSFET